jgi:antitoxin MazE
MKVKVQKWGNDLVLSIPTSLAAGLNIRQGSVVEVSFNLRRLLIDVVDEGDYKLEELLAGVTKRNLHAGIGKDRSELE